MKNYKIKINLTKSTIDDDNEVSEQMLSHVSDQELVSCLDLPEDQRLKKPEGMSIGDWFRELQNKRKMSSLFNQELIDSYRLETLRDVVIYNLNSRKWVFNEIGIRKNLNAITSEKKLMKICKMALSEDEFAFIKTLKKHAAKGDIKYEDEQK